MHFRTSRKGKKDGSRTIEGGWAMGRSGHVEPREVHLTCTPERGDKRGQIEGEKETLETGRRAYRTLRASCAPARRATSVLQARAAGETVRSQGASWEGTAKVVCTFAQARAVQ